MTHKRKISSNYCSKIARLKKLQRQENNEKSRNIAIKTSQYKSDLSNIHSSDKHNLKF